MATFKLIREYQLSTGTHIHCIYREYYDRLLQQELGQQSIETITRETTIENGKVVEDKRP